MVKSDKKTTKTPAATPVEPTPSNPIKTFFERNKIPVGIVAGLLLVSLFLLRSFFIVAFVNGTPITRSHYVAEMEKQVGADTLERIILETLIQQEARNRGIEVDETTIEEQIQTYESNISAQGGTLDSALAQQGMTRDDLRDQIRIQQLIQKMTEEDAEVTDAEIALYLEENAEVLPDNLSDEELEDLVRNQLSRQRQNEQVQVLLDRLQAQAEITYWR
jgi:foldase protein PrsA